jgi:aspartate/methionine/tyrosine aminotransferase
MTDQDPARFLGDAVRSQQANQGASQVWAEVTALSQLPGILDLGQGWPDFGADMTAREEASRALLDETDPRNNQYSMIPGRAELIKAIARYYRATGSSNAVSADGANVLVTASGTEAVYATMQATLSPGDECVFLEPFFPWYISNSKIFGAKPVAVRMNVSDDDDAGVSRYEVNYEALETALSSPACKVLIHNSPHNPTGKVFTAQENERIAAMCVKHDVMCIADEVYERCTFDDDASDGTAEPFPRMMNATGMAERTVTIGTASKLLALTGWRVGWITGPAVVVAGVKTMKSYTTFCAPTPLQLGVAAALNKISGEAEALGSNVVTSDEAAGAMATNVAVLSAALKDAGLKVIAPDGGYFLVTDVSATGLSAVEYCKRLAAEAKVASIPMVVFYDPGADGTGAPDTFVRFAVCKKPETVRACAEAIRANPVVGE